MVYLIKNSPILSHHLLKMPEPTTATIVKSLNQIFHSPTEECVDPVKIDTSSGKSIFISKIMFQEIWP
jgi:hypothetical protein